MALGGVGGYLEFVWVSNLSSPRMPLGEGEEVIENSLRTSNMSSSRIPLGGRSYLELFENFKPGFT